METNKVTKEAINEEVDFSLNKQAELNDEIDYDSLLADKFRNKFTFVGEPTKEELNEAEIDTDTVLGSIGFFADGLKIAFVTRQYQTEGKFTYRLISYLLDEEYKDVYDEMCSFVESIHSDLD